MTFSIAAVGRLLRAMSTAARGGGKPKATARAMPLGGSGVGATAGGFLRDMTPKEVEAMTAWPKIDGERVFASQSNAITEDSLASLIERVNQTGRRDPSRSQGNGRLLTPNDEFAARIARIYPPRDAEATIRNANAARFTPR